MLRMISKARPALLGLIAAIAAAGVAGCTSFKGGPVGNAAVPSPARAVDLNRYVGRWYEMARYEAPFQKDCEAVTADYTVTSPGRILVVNTCRKGEIDAKASTAKGKAKVVAGSDNAKLRVSFFGPFYGDYWVLDHAEDYSWSIVGEPSGRYLWMLTRTAKPDAATRADLERRVRAMGYDWSLVRQTQH
jgi:apolipoprotein D and lipocalin family protein